MPERLSAEQAKEFARIIRERPLPEGTCERCRGMGGIYVRPAWGGMTFVACPSPTCPSNTKAANG